MQPVICFYQNQSFLYSTDYLRLECHDPQKIQSFFEHIQSEHPRQIKVLQVDFDLQTTTVFVLHQHELIKKENLISTISDIGLQFEPAISKSNFIQKINTIKTDIQAGRYYQVNLTSRFSSTEKTDFSALDIFKYYLHIFQSPYPAFLPLADKEILCFSPELFLEKNGHHIRTCPIKGTAHKTETFENLIQDKKEEAELSMIVDLLRNDLQSVCLEKVRVDHHRKELNLNYVTHTYSEISGTTSKSLSDILLSMLPAGSISGCPKKESLVAIEELESHLRGFYTGCIGWWQDSHFKLNLAIRSFLYEKQILTYYSGCGIVFDSDPEKEWQEFHHKAKHLRLRDNHAF